MKDMESFLQWFYQLSDLLELWTLTRSFVTRIQLDPGDNIFEMREFHDLTAHLQRMENREM